MSILAAQLNAAKFFVGPELTRLRGAADDYFTISLASDLGVGVGGIQGDTMLVTRSQNLYTASLTLLQASAAIGTLLSLSESNFSVKVQYNDFSLVGEAVIMNVGDWAAWLGTTTRVITMAIAKVAGNTSVGIGTTILA